MPDDIEPSSAPTSGGPPEDATLAAPEPDQEAKAGKKSRERRPKGQKKPRGRIDLSKVVETAGAADTGRAPPSEAPSGTPPEEGREAPPGPPETPPAEPDGVEAAQASESPPPELETAPGAAEAPGSTEGEDEAKEEIAEEETEAASAPSDLGLRAAVEAIIFAADEPVTPAAIAKAIGGVKPSAVKRAIEDIRAAREAMHSGITLEEIAGGYTFLTREEFAPAIRRLRKAAEGRKLTAAALETLAVIAYKQPIQKQQIEDIRGVSCGPMLRMLMEHDLVKIVGRAEALGRPLLYGTTKKFLDVFGLGSLKDLPKTSELAPG